MPLDFFLYWLGTSEKPGRGEFFENLVRGFYGSVLAEGDTAIDVGGNSRQHCSQQDADGIPWNFVAVPSGSATAG